MNTPVFTISPKSIDLVAKIAEKVGEIKGAGEYSRNLQLRKINRLRSIQSSLAIENNTLSLGQVTDIIEGKRVLGLPSVVDVQGGAKTSFPPNFPNGTTAVAMMTHTYPKPHYLIKNQNYESRIH
jgi:hypothetical protein